MYCLLFPSSIVYVLLFFFLLFTLSIVFPIYCLVLYNREYRLPFPYCLVIYCLAPLLYLSTILPYTRVAYLVALLI